MMIEKIRLKITVFVFSMLLCVSVFSANGDVTDPYSGFRADEPQYDDSGDKPWQEDDLKDLSTPEDENLVELNIDHPPVGFKVFIDTQSITVSESDGVVRYWLVLKAGKSRNTLYEGMKCNSQQYKTYAYENKWKKGKVNVAGSAEWLPIKGGGHNHFRFE